MIWKTNLKYIPKYKNTDEETELCCGWTHIPFIDGSSRLQLLNRSYDLVLNGGSVHDKTDVPLDPNLARRKQNQNTKKHAYINNH